MMMKSVLVVDDDSTVCLSLKRLLEKENYRVFTTAKAGEALQLSSQIPLNLAIVDFNLPDGEWSGFDKVS